MNGKKLHFDYEDDKEVSILRLSSLLDGREDSKEIRELFNKHREKSDLDWSIVSSNNRLYPKWVIDEFILLKELYPTIYNHILSIGINYEQKK